MNAANSPEWISRLPASSPSRVSSWPKEMVGVVPAERHRPDQEVGLQAPQAQEEHSDDDQARHARLGRRAAQEVAARDDGAQDHEEGQEEEVLTVPGGGLSVR
ncbi:MAG: hypothetical protein ABI611_17785 [Solirubrobacteraceae bacterium]